jgi:hypothetical protein
VQAAVDDGYTDDIAIEELAKDTALSKIQSEQVHDIARKLAAANTGTVEETEETPAVEETTETES